MKAPEYVERIEALEASQTAQDAALEAAATAAGSAQATADSKVATVNGLAPDAAGNVDVGGMPLGAAFPYTGRDVPAGTLRADGATYTNMAASFPAFYAWVKQSGLAVPMADYALVEGSCGRYGLDESTGSVRMPALAAGVFGAGAASEYGQAVEAGLPGITGTAIMYQSSGMPDASGAFKIEYRSTAGDFGDGSGVRWETFTIDASRSSPVYGKSDTVTPSHVKYPWVIVVYNAATSASVAEAAEFVGLLDGKADKEAIKAYIVETWRDGTEWYRKWSDGWIEQGGRVDPLGNNASRTITLPLAYSDSTYQILLGQGFNTNYKYECRQAVFYSNDITATAFSVANVRFSGTTSAGITIDWYTCGH